MDPAGAGDGPWDTELAWHLLTVLLRIGRPAAATELAATVPSAANYVTPQLVEWLCHAPRSPLRSSGGVVTVSATAAVAFLRFLGCDVPAPLRVGLRAPDARRWFPEVPIRYVRKRKASDAAHIGVKRRLLLETDEDSAEHEQQKSQQLIVHSCSSVSTGEVHLEVMQDRLPNLGTSIVGPSLKISTGVPLVSGISNISSAFLQRKFYQFLGVSDDNVLRDRTSAIVPKEFSIPSFIEIPSLCAEKSGNIHATADYEISRIGEPKGALPCCNCRVEDREDTEKAPTPLPLTMDASLVGHEKVWVDEDLNLISREPGSTCRNCDTHAVDSIVRPNWMPNQAAVQDDCPNAGYREEIPSCGQDANASAVIQENKTMQVLSQSPTHTKAEPVLHEPIPEIRESSCQPSLDRKLELAALPLEVTSYDCITNRNLNIIAEIIESTYQNGKEQPRNEVSTEFPKKEQDKKIVKQKEKRKKNDALPKEDKDQVAENVQKGHAEPKPLPSFKDYVVEEEEGSGGYGIVYRARSKKDGRVVAIKCPRGKAHSHHVDNERKMLQRFGGKNFVIRYETCFRSGELDCFVLQHVKHDRPENLKKEINLFELQWYGYCLLKALSSLHKQGIVHRDVKPGNFLFSRDQKKGFLIDFNLANDPHQKLSRNSKSETISCGKDITSQSSLKSALAIHANGAAAESKQPLGSKRKRSTKIPAGSDPRIDNKSMYGSQAADGSAVTSAKDATSTKTSLDRLKQPFYKGRKELMNFLHEVQSPNQNAPAAPVSQRKRVAAPVGSVDRKLFVLTPMPLRSGGSAVAGSGLFNSKGHGKQRREGPCVGTKGFRAPEVLLRSSHQGCKVDVWSAGVTLLYLITGKTPFGGDPEQNMKEIVKLRGSEELWEVAKLHNCESSYPSELLDAKFLQSVDLRTWCVANARRPEFLEQLPKSLFDLVDKCLAVNPRCRITSEDALSHEFFAPCHEILQEHKSKRLRVKGLAGEASRPPLSPKSTIVKASKS